MSITPPKKKQEQLPEKLRRGFKQFRPSDKVFFNNRFFSKESEDTDTEETEDTDTEKSKNIDTEKSKDFVPEEWNTMTENIEKFEEKLNRNFQTSKLELI